MVQKLVDAAKRLWSGRSANILAALAAFTAISR